MSKRGRPQKSMEPQDVSRRKETGTRILKWRKKMGWTQEYMAEQMEKSVAAVRRYEKGEVDLHENAAKKLELLDGCGQRPLQRYHSYCEHGQRHRLVGSGWLWFPCRQGL